MAPSLRWRRRGVAEEHTWLRWRFPEISQLEEEASACDGTGIRTTGRTKSSSGAPSSAAGSMAARAHPLRHPKRQRDSGAGSRVCLQGERQSAQLAPDELQSINRGSGVWGFFCDFFWSPSFPNTCLNLWA